MRVSSYEYFDKYRNSKRFKTSPGIDLDVPILFGRTIKDWLSSLGIFITCAILNRPFSGAILFVLFFSLSPYFRNKIDPAFFSHIAWSLGLRKKFFQKNKVPHFFSYRKYMIHFGP